MKRLRFILSLGFFCLIFGVIAFPQMFFRNIFTRLLGVSPSERRRRIANGTIAWGHLVFRVACRLMNITAHIRLPNENVPCAIVIANHTSTFDIAILVSILYRVGLMNNRWVVKAALANAPVIGWMGREHGCIYVNRTKDPKDIEAIRSGAELAREDGASILLFPEGTRFTGPVPESGFEYLLPPKRGGFDRFTEALPAYPVLSITIRWDPPLRSAQGKTIFQATDLVGKELFIDAEIVPAEAVGTDPDWLLHEWKRKDAALGVPLP